MKKSATAVRTPAAKKPSRGPAPMASASRQVTRVAPAKRSEKDSKAPRAVQRPPAKPTARTKESRARYQAAAPAAPPAKERVHVAAHLGPDDRGQDLPDLGPHGDAHLASDVSRRGREQPRLRAPPAYQVVLLAPRVVRDRLDLEPLLHLGGRESFLHGRCQNRLALLVGVGLALSSCLGHETLLLGL